MLLYHLMADEGVLPNKVIPQVPQNLMQGEDQSIATPSTRATQVSPACASAPILSGMWKHPAWPMPMMPRTAILQTVAILRLS